MDIFRRLFFPFQIEVVFLQKDERKGLGSSHLLSRATITKGSVVCIFDPQTSQSCILKMKDRKTMLYE